MKKLGWTTLSKNRLTILFVIRQSERLNWAVTIGNMNGFLGGTINEIKPTSRKNHSFKLKKFLQISLTEIPLNLKQIKR